jgi:hypothetical protein
MKFISWFSWLHFSIDKLVLLALGLLATIVIATIIIFSFLQKRSPDNSQPSNPTIESQE